MSFLYPGVFWLIPLLVVAALFLWSREKKSLADIFAKEVYEKLISSRSGLSATLRLVLLVISMVLMITALARPVMDEQIIKVNETAIDVIAALDISRSMEAEDLYPNRLVWGKKKLLDMIGKGEDLRIGVMAFAANAYVVSPLTSDDEVASYLVENLNTDAISEKGTDILQLIDAAAKQLKQKAHKYLLLITDGGDEADYKEAISRAKEEGIVVFVLATATPKGAPIKEKEGGFVKKDGDIILTRLNDAIKELAFKTGGAYIVSSASSQDVDAMLAEIRHIATDETIASSSIKKYRELFSYFLAATLALLLLAFSSWPKRETALLLALLFVSLPSPTYAGVMDFATISEAEKAYEKGDFNLSSQTFESLAKSTPGDEVHYDLGNAYYKQKRYKDAIAEYKKITPRSPLQQKALHNSGNAYAYGNELEKAKTEYEAALKIGEDQQTRENLEEVVRHLKKEEPKKQDPKDQENKEQQEKQGEKQQDKDQEQKNKSSQQNGQKDESKSQEGAKPQQQKQQTPQEQQEAKEQEADRKAKQKEQSLQQKSQADSQPDPQEKSEKMKGEKRASQKEITDKEERKLLEMLDNQKGQTYRYYIPSEHKKDQHDKPW